MIDVEPPLRRVCGCPVRSLQGREKLLETKLFVRCAAAMLHGMWTGGLQVDAGAGVGYEVDEGAGALRLRVGETEYSPEGACVSARQCEHRFLINHAVRMSSGCYCYAAPPSRLTARKPMKGRKARD